MGQPSSADDYLTVAEVADLLKLNQQTIRNWIDRNELPALRLGSRRVRIRRADLDAKLAGSWSSSRTNELGEDPGPKPRDPAPSDPRADLAAALTDAQSALGDGDNAELARSLRHLAGAAEQLADQLLAFE